MVVVGAGAADCVREHREPAARARHGAASRAERARGARRVADANRATAARGEPAAVGSSAPALGLLFARWGSQLLVRQLSTPTNNVFLDLSLDWRVLGSRRGRRLHGAPLRHRARVRAARACSRTMRSRRRGAGWSATPGSALGNAARRRAGRAVADPRRRRGSVCSHVRLARAPAISDSIATAVLVARINAQRAPARARRSGRSCSGGCSRRRRRVPGVASASLSAVTPISGSTGTTGSSCRMGRRCRSRSASTYINLISADWFRTYGTA